MGNLITALEKLEANCLYLTAELRSDVSLTLEDLTPLSTGLTLMLDECKMNYIHKETRDGTIKTSPRRKTGFHKGNPMVRHLDEPNSGSNLNLDSSADLQPSRAIEEGNDSDPDLAGLHSTD